MFAQVVRQSAGASWVAEHDLDNLLAGDDDTSFTLELCCKDLRLIAELAYEIDYEPSLAAVARRWFERARETYGAAAGELAVPRCRGRRSCVHSRRRHYRRRPEMNRREHLFCVGGQWRHGGARTLVATTGPSAGRTAEVGP